MLSNLGVCRREMEVESARPPPAQQALTPRQLARMADLSLLLDVVLKSQAASVRREFVRCGVLRQLQSSIGRNASPQFHVVRRRAAATTPRHDTSSCDLAVHDISGV